MAILNTEIPPVYEYRETTSFNGNDTKITWHTIIYHCILFIYTNTHTQFLEL